MAQQLHFTETRNGKRVLTGDLPDDFLRLPVPQGENSGRSARTAQNRIENLDRSLLTRIEISLAEARLVKNYGVGRMNLYCRVRVGARVELTRTGNSGKNPRWNHVIQCELLPGVTTLLVEVLDARAFSEDERVAWAHVELPDAVVSGQTVMDNWFDLNGKQGTGAEGQIKMVVSCVPPARPQPVGGIPTMGQHPALFQQPQQQQQQQQQPQTHTEPQPRPQQQVVRISQAELQGLLDMFPSMQKEVVVSVLESCGGDMDVAVTNLLTLSET